MQFDASEIVLIITALGAVTVQIIQAWRNGTAVKENTVLTAQTLMKTDAVAIATAKIEAHVNSDKTADIGRLAAKDIQIDMLNQMLTRERTATELLAQAKATSDAAAASAAAATTTNLTRVINGETLP